MSTIALPLTEETVMSLWQMAESQGTTAEALAEQAIRRYLRQQAEAKIAREEEHYRAQHTELLERYSGRYIAMHEGRVIDTDSDELALYLRIRQRFPLIGILIKKVTEEPEEIWMIRSPRFEYGS